MARVTIARPGKKGISDVDLVFERVFKKPAKAAGEWVEVPAKQEEYALYRDVTPFPRKMYFTRDESEELLGLIAQELGLSLSFR